MSKIENAQITGTMLGVEDHGIMTCFVYLGFGSGSVGFGGYGLDEWDKEANERIDNRGYTGEYIKELMRVVGVEKWEDLKGKYVRVDSEGIGGIALGIGNLMKDEWFYPKEFFKRYE